MNAKSVVQWARELPGGENIYNPATGNFYIDNYYRWVSDDSIFLLRPPTRAATQYWKSL